MVETSAVRFEKVKMVSDSVGKEVGTEGTVQKKLIFPDLSRLMSTHQTVGSYIELPVNEREGKAAFWERGGKDPKFNSAIGTVIAGANGRLMPIITVNKKDRKPNGNQALMPLVKDGKLYVGKLQTRPNDIRPKIKVFELTYEDHIASDVPGIAYGRFKLTAVFSSYGDMDNNIPAKLLVDKLFTKNVVRPFYGQGWSLSDISEIEMDWAVLIAKGITYPEPEELVEKAVNSIEEYLTSLANTGLSSAVQVFNLNTGISTVIPLSGLSLGDIAGSVDKITTGTPVAARTKDLIGFYNRALSLDVDSEKTLELVVSRDDGKYTRKIGPGLYVCLRGWKG